jgi:hypothetical protein
MEFSHLIVLGYQGAQVSRQIGVGAGGTDTGMVSWAVLGRLARVSRSACSDWLKVMGAAVILGTGSTRLRPTL